MGQSADEEDVEAVLDELPEELLEDADESDDEVPPDDDESDGVDEPDDFEPAESVL